MPAVRFTPENAKHYAARSIASRKANGWKAKAKDIYLATPAELINEAAHERISRLWACLELIDKRLGHELNKEHPNGQLLKDLASTAKMLRDQADDPATNGKLKAAAPAAPDLPEPTPDPTP